MKLQSHISRKYKNNSYRKFWIIIPKKLIEKLGWKTGQELKTNIKKNKLVINKNDTKNLESC